LANRDFLAARSSWRRAQQIADGLPDDDPERSSMRIAPRAVLCGTAHRLGGGTDTRFEELRELCTASGDMRSLAMGLNGHLTVALFEARRREASRLADEMIELLESIGDPTLSAALSLSALTVKSETAEMSEVLRLTQQIIELADDKPGKDAEFIGSPMALAYALRGEARACLGLAGWKEDMRKATAIAQNFNPLTRQAVSFYTYGFAIPYGVLVPDATALRDTAETLAITEHAADNTTLFVARLARGITLFHHGGRDREVGLELLASTREHGSGAGFSLLTKPIADIHVALEKARIGELDTAVDLSRSALDVLSTSGDSIWCALATTGLVEALMQRGRAGDLDDAEMEMSRLVSVPTEPGFVLFDITLRRLSTLMAKARGDEVGYRDLRARYRKMAYDLGFEGHIAWAAAI
jgi:adenylate cyclase